MSILKNSMNLQTENINIDDFAKIILREYGNKDLDENEIKEIICQAHELGLIENADLDTGNVNTEDLIKTIRKARNSYLNCDIPLEENVFLSQKYHTPISYDKQNSPFYNQKKELTNYNMDMHTPGSVRFGSPYINKTSNIENPFKEDEDLQSFCDDLRIKTSSIKKEAVDKSVKLLDEVIDKFVLYNVKKETKKKTSTYSMFCIFFFILLSSSLFFMYNPVPY